jgi:hypothetical protein
MSGAERTYWQARTAWRRAAKAARERLAWLDANVGGLDWYTDPDYARLHGEYKLAHEAYQRADRAWTWETHRR